MTLALEKKEPAREGRLEVGEKSEASSLPRRATENDIPRFLDDGTPFTTLATSVC